MSKLINAYHLDKMMNYLRKEFCAPSAAKLKTPVKINGVEFDGSKDVVISAAFEMDTEPTADSNKFVTSGAVHKAIQNAILSIENGDALTY